MSLKKIILCALFCVVLSRNAYCVNSESDVGTPLIDDEKWLEKQMNLECSDRSLQEVLEEVAIYFQTEIVYEAKDAKLPMQCSFSKVTVEQILDRLFHKQNRAILVEKEPERRIAVQVFGVSLYNVVDSDGIMSTQSMPFLANMTNEALVEMQREQLREYQEEQNDLQAVIPLAGITRAEVQELHLEQAELYNLTKNNPQENVVGTTLTAQELSVLHEQQLNLYEIEKNNPKQVDPFTGLTVEELTTLHQQQISEIN